MSKKPIRFKSPARLKACINNKSAPRNTSLEKAVNSNDLEKVKEAIKKDDENICGTVTFAITNGKSIEIIRYLLECEKDDLIDETRLAGLNSAIKSNNEKLAKDLLDDIEQRMIEVIKDDDLRDDLFDDLDEAVYTASTCSNKNLLKIIEAKLSQLENVYYGDSDEESEGGSDDEEESDDDDDDSGEDDDEESESEDDEESDDDEESEEDEESEDDEESEENEESEEEDDTED